MLSDRIIRIVEKQADRLEERWADMVKTHPATPSYHNLDDDDLEASVREVYRHLGLYLDNLHDAQKLAHVFMRIGETRAKQGIPLQELIYAIVLCRRNLWDFIEEEGVFVSSLQFHQLDMFLHRILRFFDKSLYFIVTGYEEGVPEVKKEKELISKMVSDFYMAVPSAPAKTE